ncbi:MAG: DNA translocase FtsK 4TM domain-containing protein [Candidatus Pacebacteria bacterium]|nr:DNA translocase FtsK 4TM domain-containing protein [Candidatus Paceibacterota bacterium]
MSKKESRKNKRSKQDQEPKNSLSPFKDLQEDTLHSVLAILFFVASIFLLMGAGGKGGPVGDWVYNFLHYLFGIGYYLVPLLLFLLAISFIIDHSRRFPISKALGSFVFFFSGLGLLSIVREANGGILGDTVANPMLKFFGLYASVIFLLAFVIISLLIIFDTRLKRDHILFWNLFRKEKDSDDVEDKEMVIKGIGDKDLYEEKPPEEKIKETITAKPAKTDEMESKGGIKNDPSEEDSLGMKERLFGKKKASEVLPLTPFTPPPLSLLENDRGKPGVGDIKANANIIKRTLQNFGIDVEMDEISIGPSVTRYALKPAEGVKLSRILGLQNNLALALAAHPIRIEAPIPGKSLVGIEIPNNIKTTVGLGTLLSQPEFQESEKPLLISLGKGISGKSYFTNLAKSPHILIAGATGSGKSVTIHAIITSLLYRNSPYNLKFIMIDPKRVELTLYNKIPHLLTPVITDAKKAILALKWAAKEMDRRYDILEKNSVRDIDSYHKNILAPALKKLEDAKGKSRESEDTAEEATETMPYIIIVIDELADIMQAYPRELEAAIVRLAQMSRAVGIHLMLSTQRPSVNVITGLIKANVPSRIALQVASQIDSRTILDARGAEELLGAGDMLYQGSEMSTPQRLQSAYITETEVKNVVKYLINNNQSLASQINLSPESNGGSAVHDPIFDQNSGALSSSGMNGFDDDVGFSDDDDLYEDAKVTVLEAGKASTSYIQRKLRVGYARAARLMDMLEERGVIGPADGAKPREVINYDGGAETEMSETAENRKSEESMVE